MKFTALPALTDNYIWMLQDGQRAAVVDPGEARPVLDALAIGGLRLEAILVTHHHADHTGGIQALREATAASVAGPAREAIPQPARPLAGGARVTVLDHDFTVIDVPGHTAGHIAFYCEDVCGTPLLFCGDALFSAGCGRLFEGTAADMLASLDALAALPPATQVCCTHEYTLGNLAFAQAVEPSNAEVNTHAQRCRALRAAGQPTLPSSIGMELQINPFLRTREPAVVQAAQRFDPEITAHDPVAVFAALRRWKDVFKQL
jgi:hydroxyacylglutathione hydrolase